MAIVNLGTRNLVIGENPVSYDPFAYDVANAYIMAYQFTTVNFSSVFSRVKISPLIQISPTVSFSHPEPVTLDIEPGLRTVYIAMSSLFIANGTCVIQAQRLANRYGGADNAPIVSLGILYEDTDVAPTWRN